MHLRDVHDVAQLRKVGGDVLAPAEVEEGVVLLEGVHQPQGLDKVADIGDDAPQPAALRVLAVLLE